MTTPRAIVLRAAGTNCDRETEFALQQVGFETSRVHVFEVMRRPEMLADYQFLVIPGGFSYGDDIASGKIFAMQLTHRLAEPLSQFIAADKLILGICNGFQVMVKCGLLPWGKVSPDAPQTDVTVGWNDSGRYEDRWVYLRADSKKNVFLPHGEVLALPVAHGEGKVIPRDETVLARLRDGDQIAVRYVTADGQLAGGVFPANPNGAVDDMAGLCDPTGRVMGLMPHPERFIDLTQHPSWTRGDVKRADGKLFFERARAFFKD